MRHSVLRKVVFLFSAIFVMGLAVSAQDVPSPTSAPQKQSSQKQLEKQKKKARKELGYDFAQFIQEDAKYIIMPEEIAAFKRLGTNEGREQFIENFWERRNPNPDSTANEFKEEHYRRIAYANEHFTS